jgi:hypothetical protein
MPAEYMACVESEMKGGKDKKSAQRMCAIAYYKKHGKTVQEAHRAAGSKMDDARLMDLEKEFTDKDEVPELFKLYAPITKVDEEKRMVFGYATTDTLDSQGEIVDLQATFDAADEYSEWRTINEMHRADSAVGVALVLEKHVGVGLFVGAKIVDDQAWAKCREKVYRGFSIEGRVRERNVENPKRITKYQLRKISVVDRPANPDSLFQVAKRDDEVDATPSQEGAGGDKLVNEPVNLPSSQPQPSGEAAVNKAAETQTASPPAPEMVAKSELESLQKRYDEMKTKHEALEKQFEEKQKEDAAFQRVMEKLGTISPELKKIQTVAKTAEELEKEKITKMSNGEVMAAALRSAAAGE